MNDEDPFRLNEESGDEYLWDGSGAPASDIVELERMLRPLRHRGAAPIAHAARAAPSVPQDDPIRMPAPGRARRLAAAAMIGLGVLAALLAPRQTTHWTVEPLAGAPTLGVARLDSASVLRPREWIETDAGSRARIDVQGLGDVRVEPGSRIRVLAGPANRRLLELSRGAIHAFISAPPRMFQVATPAARAVDLGCEYTLRVDGSGGGELRVLLGYVQLERDGRTVTIPMDGGTCLMRPGSGPGTPYFDDASPRFIDELKRFDFESGGEPALNAVLSEARPRDALSLWHLLRSAPSEERGAVYDRLSQLKPPPSGVTRTGILALDQGMLDAWWDDMRPF